MGGFCHLKYPQVSDLEDVTQDLQGSGALQIYNMKTAQMS